MMGFHWSFVLFAIIASLSSFISADAFVKGIPSKQSATSRSRRTIVSAGLDISPIVKSKFSVIAAAAAAAATTAAPSTVGTIVAKALGYVIGVGSLAVYLPIVFSLLKKKSADGFSVATWVFNLMGITLAVIYPLKKGFPVSTFVELLLLVVQSTGILGKTLQLFVSLLKLS